METIIIVGNINEYIKIYALKNLMMCINHPDRDCVYQEAEAVIELKKDIRKHCFNPDQQSILDENYPKNNGMIASGILYRKHNNPVCKRTNG